MTIRQNHLEDKVRLVFNAFNTEYRAIIDGFLLDKSEYRTEAQIYSRMLELLPQEEFKKRGRHSHSIERQLKKGISKAKLQPFVTEKEEPLAWKISYDPVPHHDDIARFLLYMASVKYNLGLTKLLGKSQDDGPYTTVKVLEYVVKHNIHTIKGLEEKLSLSPQQVIAKVKRMQKAGLLTYKSFYSDSGKDSIKYKVNPSIIKSAERDNSFKYPLLTRKILDIFRENPNQEYSAAELAGELEGSYEGTVNKVLRILHKKRVLDCNVDWKSKIKTSDVSATVLGMEFYKTVIVPIYSLLKSGTGIRDIQRKALWQENLCAVADKYLGNI